MKYCVKCLQPDTRPNLILDTSGVCPACNYMENVWPYIDWEERAQELHSIVSRHKNPNSVYDCIIGVSGGKDSLRQALYVKNQLKLKPLLVCCSYPPEQVTERGTDNISNMISNGFDTVVVAPRPKTWRKLVRKGFYEFGNWQKSTELALFSSVPRVAVAYQIPLILWGENPALTLGELGNQSLGGEANKMKYSNTLKGGDYSWLLDDDIKPQDVIEYQYPSDEDMDKAKLKIYYLGYYWKTWSKVDNANFSILHGLKVRRDDPAKIGDTLGVDSLDEDWVLLNNMVKYYKFGFGKVTEIVSEHIRHGLISRADGIEVVEKYDGKCGDELIEGFCEYVEITRKEFDLVIDKYTDRRLFNVENGKKIPKFRVGVGL